MELARRGTIGLAAVALAALMALVLALAMAPGRALAKDFDYELTVGESAQVTYDGDIGYARSEPSGVVSTTVGSQQNILVITALGEGEAQVLIIAGGTNYSYDVKVTASTTYTLTLAANPTDGGAVTAEPAKESYSAGDQVTITATPADGFKFVGWTDVSGISTPNGPTATFDMPAGNVGATAVFEQTPVEPKEPKVTVEPEGAGTVDVVHDAESKNWVLTAKANSGWTFKCWRENGEEVKVNPYSVDESLSHDIVAVFEKEPITTYAITFDANDGTGTMDKQTAEAGATVALTANAFKRDGYTFAGWNTAKDGSGTKYADKAEVKVEGDMTLYAQWTKDAAPASTSKSTTAKTGDTVTPMAAIAVIAVIAAGALLLARRRMA